jgi:hypothetical protein
MKKLPLPMSSLHRLIGIVFAGVLTTVLCSTPLPARAGAMGISPLSLRYDQALRGGSQVQTILLSNQPSSGNPGSLAFSVKAQGEVAPWVSFLTLDDETPRTIFEVPQTQTTVVRVMVNVPSSAANRLYNGSIYIEATDPKAVQKPGESGVGTATELPIAIAVDGVERREAAVRDFLVEPAEVGLKQRFVAKVANTGNIAVASQLDVTIKRGGKDVTSLSTEGQNIPILPGVDGDVTVDWDTAEELGGDYTAALTVSDIAGDKPKVLGTKTVPFRLEPRGTFTRSGEFTKFILLNPPVKGELLVAEATFLNSGKIPTQAILESDISLNGKLVKTVQSLPRTVRPGATGRITVAVDSVEEGNYTIKGRINYDGEVSNERELKFALGADSSIAAGPSAGPTTTAPAAVTKSSSPSSVPYLVGGGAAVISAAAVAFVLGRRKR